MFHEGVILNQPLLQGAHHRTGGLYGRGSCPPVGLTSIAKTGYYHQFQLLGLDERRMDLIRTPVVARAATLASRVPHLPRPLLPLVVIAVQVIDAKRGNIYNILWILVFAFATLNILSLVGRRFEPSRSRLNLGEMMAILVVIVSIFLLSWEMLYVFHILPIKLEPR
jgi:hypothetical protein